MRTDISKIVAHDLGRAVARAGYVAVEVGDCLTIVGDKIESHTTSRKRAIVVALIRQLEEAKEELAEVIARCDDGAEMLRKIAEDMTLELARGHRR